MAKYAGSVSFYDHIEAEADDEEEAREEIEKKAEKIARRTGLEIQEIVEITEI